MEQENSSTFKRQVEIGRIALINYGPFEGKLAVIVSIIDHSRALVDIFDSKDCTVVNRQAFPFRRMVLTPVIAKSLEHSASRSDVKKVLASDNVLEKWNKLAWAKKIEQRQRRVELTDFERFKVQKLKALRRKELGSSIHKAKKELVSA